MSSSRSITPELDQDLFIDKSYKEIHFSFGGREVDVLALETATTSYDLTGQIVWPAAELLCHFISKNEQLFTDKVALELGAGSGLAGIFAAPLCKEMILTDYHEVVLELLDLNAKKSAAACGKRVSCCPLLWGDASHHASLREAHPNGFELLIGADIVHWLDFVEPLIASIDALLAADGECIIAYVARSASTERKLLATLQSSPFVVTEHQLPCEIPESVLCAGPPHIISLRRKPAQQ